MLTTVITLLGFDFALIGSLASADDIPLSIGVVYYVLIIGTSSIVMRAAQLSKLFNNRKRKIYSLILDILSGDIIELNEIKERWFDILPDPREKSSNNTPD